MATRDGTGEQAGMTGTSSVTVFSYFPLLFLSFFFFSNYLFFSGVCITTGGQDGADQRERRSQRRTGRGGTGHNRYVFFCFWFSSYSPLLFFSLFLSLLSHNTATDGAGPSGTGQDGTMRAVTAMHGGTGGRRAREGGRRWEEGGLAGNMGTTEAEGQVTKGCD